MCLKCDLEALTCMHFAAGCCELTLVQLRVLETPSYAMGVRSDPLSTLANMHYVLVILIPQFSLFKLHDSD